MPSNKNDNQIKINDIKQINNEILTLYKEIRKEAKNFKNKNILYLFDIIDLNLDYKSVLFQNLNTDGLNDLYRLSEIIKQALFDTQELLKKGTEYGIKLSLDRISALQKDRTLVKSPYLIKGYYDFENNLWNIIKLRELTYGEIIRLRKKQDEITKAALNEIDPMMRVRYFEDIRVLENDILRLEKEAHSYDVIQTTLHNEKSLKSIVKHYATQKDELLQLETFEKLVNKFSGGNENDN